MKTRFILLWVVFLSANLTWAQEKDNALKTKSVSIFKNGTAFFIKEGTVKPKDGSYIMTDNIPRALFGTFWIHSPNKELKHVTSYNDQVTTKTENVAISFIDLLEANKGKKMKIHIGKDEVYEGTTEEVIMKDSDGNEKRFINQSVIVFKTNSQWLSFSPVEIRRIEFLEKPNQLLEKETTTNKNILSVDFTTKRSEQPLEMMYLENGLNWVPTYLIELKSDTKAKLSLRAEVTNGAEDIEGADVNFVVGIPNFRYANRLSSLVDFLGMIYPTNNIYAGNNFSNSLTTQRLDYALEEATVTATGTPMGNGVTGDGDEDLYFYNVKNINLKNGGRGQYPVFSEDIEIAHIYECNLAQNSAAANYYQKDFLFTPDNQNPVFHSIKVNNNLEFPWTTGSAMVVSEKSGTTRPISQDMLNYTPIKGHSYVKLTESPDIKVKHAEKEIAREQKVRRVNTNNRYYYDLVTVEGKIKVKSYKDKKVDLNLKRMIYGDLQETDVKWLKAERVNRTGDINKITDVCWETSISGGEELEITYTYKVYVQVYY